MDVNKMKKRSIDDRKIKSNRRDTSKYLTNNVGEKPKRNYNLIKDIRSQKLIRSNVEVRDMVARKYLMENYDAVGPRYILPGQLVMFNYFTPLTKDELEYYDAKPVTIFFGIYNSKKGKRIIGFNIHYYPPRIRYQIMNRIFEIYKPFYLKSFNNPIKKTMSHFEYSWLMQQLESAKLDFGVRQYDPSLCGGVTPIPAEAWAKAVFTEGHFKKSTRDKILQYWKEKEIKKQDW